MADDADPYAEHAPGSYATVPIAPRAFLPAGKPLGSVVCPGYSGTDKVNPLASVLQDMMTFPPFAPVKVGDGKGNVNWKLDPYHNPSWTLWLLDLRWIGSLLEASEATGDQVALAHAQAIVQSWIAGNPVSTWAGDEAGEGRAHRTEVLICMALDIGLPTWLEDSLETHAEYLEDNYSGYSNHGVDEDLALFDTGCLLGQRTFTDFAVARLTNTVAHLVDLQGVSIEQSTGYADYDYSLLLSAGAKLTACGYPVPAVVSQRLALMPQFLAQSTMPDGDIPQIGDGALAPQIDFPGTAVEYPATLGSSGTPPTARTAIFSAGYAFGRSSWAPYTAASWYALRFGPPRIVHGHFDHMSLLYYARGHQVLTNAGFYGYVASPQTTFTKSLWGANVLNVLGDRFTDVATTLAQSVFGPTTDFYEVSDEGYAGVTRSRSVLMVRGPDFAVVMDRLSSLTSHSYQQLWHLLPDESVTVTGRSYAVAVPADHSSRTYLMQVTLPGQTLPAGSTYTVIGQTTPSLQGWVSQQPYDLVRAPTVEMTRAASSLTFVTLIIPTRYNAKVAFISLVQDAKGYYHLSLTVDGQLIGLVISNAGGLSRSS